jgi:purine-binding chemotaxis protein CheW
MKSARQLCTFFLDGDMFGLPVHDVQEILLLQQLTPVPTAAPAVAGVINLRGQMVTAIELCQCLEYPSRSLESQVHLVVQLPGEVVSLLVDDVGDVVEVFESDFEPPPQTLPAAMAQLVTGAYKLPGRLVLVLDAERVALRAQSAKPSAGVEAASKQERHL